MATKASRFDFWRAKIGDKRDAVIDGMPRAAAAATPYPPSRARPCVGASGSGSRPGQAQISRPQRVHGGQRLNRSRASRCRDVRYYRGFKWCPGAESNHRHRDFQSRALPTELPGRRAGPDGPLSKARGVIKARLRTVQNAGWHSFGMPV
jgi:hypothetical protein